jgi:hypothetical protein
MADLVRSHVNRSTPAGGSSVVIPNTWRSEIAEPWRSLDSGPDSGSAAFRLNDRCLFAQEINLSPEPYFLKRSPSLVHDSVTASPSALDKRAQDQMNLMTSNSGLIKKWCDPADMLVSTWKCCNRMMRRAGARSTLRGELHIKSAGVADCCLGRPPTWKTAAWRWFPI